MMKRAMLLLAVILLLLVPTIQAGADGLVFSAGMEDGFYAYQGWFGDIAEPFAPWWAPPEEPDFADVASLKRPEFQDTSFSHSGSHAQVLKNVYSVGEGGLTYTLDVPIGSTITVGAWFYGWSSSGDNFQESVGGSLQFRVGIAANGEDNWYRDPTIVWNEPRDFFVGTTKDLDRWTYREVSAVALVDTIQFWVGGRSEWPLKHNDIYIDDVTVTVEGSQPTATVHPSTTALPTVPTPTMPIPTIQPTGQPTTQPTIQPTIQPTTQPTVTPTPGPTCLLYPDEAEILMQFLNWLLGR